MPVFEYKCRQCGHQFEYLVLHSSPAAECPACHKQDLEQQISLCAGSEARRQANLGAAHVEAAAVRNEKLRQQHSDLHGHFEDRSSAAQPADAPHHQD